MQLIRQHLLQYPRIEILVCIEIFILESEVLIQGDIAAFKGVQLRPKVYISLHKKIPSEYLLSGIKTWFLFHQYLPSFSKYPKLPVLPLSVQVSIQKYRILPKCPLSVQVSIILLGKIKLGHGQFITFSDWTRPFRCLSCIQNYPPNVLHPFRCLYIDISFLPFSMT